MLAWHAVAVPASAVLLVLVARCYALVTAVLQRWPRRRASSSSGHSPRSSSSGGRAPSSSVRVSVRGRRPFSRSTSTPLFSQRPQCVGRCCHPSILENPVMTLVSASSDARRRGRVCCRRLALAPCHRRRLRRCARRRPDFRNGRQGDSAWSPHGAQRVRCRSHHRADGALPGCQAPPARRPSQVDLKGDERMLTALSPRSGGPPTPAHRAFRSASSPSSTSPAARSPVRWCRQSRSVPTVRRWPGTSRPGPAGMSRRSRRRRSMRHRPMSRRRRTPWRVGWAGWACSPVRSAWVSGSPRDAAVAAMANASGVRLALIRLLGRPCWCSSARGLARATAAHSRVVARCLPTGHRFRRAGSGRAHLQRAVEHRVRVGKRHRTRSAPVAGR